MLEQDGAVSSSIVVFVLIGSSEILRRVIDVEELRFMVNCA